MNDNYLLKLLKQFHEADGITSLMKVDDSFIYWLKEYQKLLLEFKDYYESIGLSIDGWDTYEIGKCPLDSVILDKARCISMYGDIKSELYVFDYLPTRISSSGIEELNYCDLFYTYNSYTDKDIELFRHLHQIGQLISISAIGKIFDKDKNKKIKLLDTIFSDEVINSNYEESGDNYFYTLYTPRHVR